MPVSQPRQLHFRVLCYGLLTCCLWLAGCVQLQRTPVEPATDTRLAPPDVWESRGKIALRVLDAEALPELRNQVVNYRWSQSGPSRTRLTLSGTLGFGRLVIEQDEQGASLRRGEELLSEAERLDQLVWVQTGIELPTQFLRYWVTGHPAPGDNHTRLRADPPGTPAAQLAGISQSGWTIRYPETTAVDGYLLPKRIEASDGRIALRIAVASWQFREDPTAGDN